MPDQQYAIYHCPDSANDEQQQVNCLITRQPVDPVGIAGGRSEIPMKTVAADRCKKDKCHHVQIRSGLLKQITGLYQHQYSTTGNKKIAVNKKTEDVTDDPHHQGK